jgi:hypothetical protein
MDVRYRSNWGWFTAAGLPLFSLWPVVSPNDAVFLLRLGDTIEKR